MSADDSKTEYAILRLITSWLPDSPLARQYLLAGIAIQFILAVALVQAGGSYSLMISALGTLGLIFRWRAMPVITLILFVFFQLFPDGDPYLKTPSDIPGSHFRMIDLLLCGLIATSIYCHYNSLSLSLQAIPDDPLPEPGFPGSRMKRSGKNNLPDSIVRPSSNTFEREFLEIVAMLALALFLAQLAWYGLTHLVVDFQAFPLLRWMSEGIRSNKVATVWPAGLSPPMHRMMIFAAAILAGGFTCWFAFWYWRLSQLPRLTALMIVNDVAWKEHRREMQRQERWRAWASGGTLSPSLASEVREWLQWLLWLVLVILIAILVGVGAALFRTSIYGI